MGVRLPPEYQKVEFLESTGTQFIRPNIPMKSAYRVKYGITFSRVNAIQQVFAAIDSSTSLYFPYIGSTNGQMYIGYNGAISVGFTFSANTYYVIESELLPDSRVVKVNGSEIYRNTSVKSSINISTLLDILRSNNPQNPRNAYAKLHFLEVYNAESDEIIANFIPCYRKSDNKPGLYDLANSRFYINANTGEFLVGADVIDSISPWLVARRRGLMIPKVYGPNLISLSDFTKISGNATWSVDDETGIITVTGSVNYSAASTEYGFVRNKMIVGHTYEMHCKLVSATDLSGARFTIRGKSGNEDQIAYSVIPTDIGEEASVIFTVDRYMSYFSLFSKWTTGGSQTVAYSDVWVKEILR